MFRRLEGGLPRDPTFPVEFTALGYKITDTGLIRKINKPGDGFQYFVSTNPRYNEVHKEAFNRAIQRWVLDEIARLGLCRLHLPQFSTKSLREKHVSILCHPPGVLRRRKRILIVINDIHQDLGVWSYRYLGREGGGLVEGTAVGIAADLLKRSICKVKSGEVDSRVDKSNEQEDEYQPSFKRKAEETKSINARQPSRLRTALQANEDLEGQSSDSQQLWGIIVVNPGQLLFSHSLSGAISHASWNALPRPSAVHPPVRKDFEANFVTGNSTPEEHIKFVFEKVIGNSSIVAPDAELYVIANGSICAPFAQMLDEQWYTYKNRIKAVALLQPSLEQGDILDFDLVQFLRSNARSWETSESEIGTLIASAETDNDAIINVKLAKLTTDEDEAKSADSASNSSDVVMQRKVVCPTYSSGVSRWEDLILPTVYSRVLDFLETFV